MAKNHNKDPSLRLRVKGKKSVSQRYEGNFYAKINILRFHAIYNCDSNQKLSRATQTGNSAGYSNQ